MRDRANVHISEVLPLLLSGFALPYHERSGKVQSGWATDALRKFLLARDKGVCRKCGADCVALWDAISWYANNRKDGMLPVGFLISAIGRRARNWPRTLWHADHIVPIIHGGVRFDPKNLQTLCFECHRLKSKQDVKPRAFSGKARAEELTSQQESVRTI